MGNFKQYAVFCLKVLVIAYVFTVFRQSEALSKSDSYMAEDQTSEAVLLLCFKAQGTNEVSVGKEATFRSKPEHYSCRQVDLVSSSALWRTNEKSERP